MNATENISIWAEIRSSSERITNACESFHHKYNSLFYTHHPVHPEIFGNIEKKFKSTPK